MSNNNKPFFTEEAVCAYECVSAYLDNLRDFMYHGPYNHDADLNEATRVMRSYAKSAIAKIVEHMP